MIGIIDYGVANLGSMRNMLIRIGVEPLMVATAGQVEQVNKIILPGIGAFDQGVMALQERGLVPAPILSTWAILSTRCGFSMTRKLMNWFF